MEGMGTSDMEKKMGIRDVGIPALPLSQAFPQATPMSTFPPAYCDYFQLNDLLTSEEQDARKKAREVAVKTIAPVIVKYWEKAEFPIEVIPKIASLNVAGAIIEGYGCSGMSLLASAISIAELGRVDASCAAFLVVHSFLSMFTIAKFGDENQKRKYLPSMASLESLSCFALSEPNHGSDASSLTTTATKVEGGWRLDGQKRWIGNSTFADILIIIARNTTTGEINAFIAKKDAPGMTIAKIENKVALRCVQNGDIIMEGVFIPEEDRIPGVKSFQETIKALVVARILVAWQAIGMAMGVYDMCHRYLQERKQFGSSLNSFQINQEKLVRMLGNIQAMTLMGWRLCKLYDDGKMTVGHASLTKVWTSLRARETIALGRELMGGNGILTDFLVAKAFCDMETTYSYEGSHEINSLISGREITGVASFKAPNAKNKTRHSKL